MREFLIVFRAPYVPRRTDLRAEKMNTFWHKRRIPSHHFRPPGSHTVTKRPPRALVSNREIKQHPGFRAFIARPGPRFTPYRTPRAGGNPSIWGTTNGHPGPGGPFRDELGRPRLAARVHRPASSSFPWFRGGLNSTPKPGAGPRFRGHAHRPTSTDFHWFRGLKRNAAHSSWDPGPASWPPTYQL